MWVCVPQIAHSLSMSDKRLWKILNWNIRGINAEEKLLALANKIEESGCDIIRLQETKRQIIDLDFIKKIVLENSTSLSTCLQLEPRDELLPFGIAIYLRGKLVFPMSSLFQ
jgi:hypothetical protein